MKYSTSKQTGFTIVELLIVIVVIGILAAITAVAYGGITERARMSGALAFEQQLRKKYLHESTGNWNFDECSGSTVKNSSNVTNSDTITGVATWVTDTPSGVGCALNFNGNTRIETLSNLGATYYVKGAWVRMTACTGGNILSQAATNGAVTALYAPSCRPNTGHNGAWSTLQSPNALTIGKWHYVAAVWESGVLTLYVDGRTIQSGSAPTPTNSGGNVSIGSHLTGNYFVGDIDNPFVSAQ